MRLRDLNPKLTSDMLVFDCPLGHGHRITVPTGPGGWNVSGAFPDALTVTPSINAKCGWHGFVTDGEAR